MINMQFAVWQLNDLEIDYDSNHKHRNIPPQPLLTIVNKIIMNYSQNVTGQNDKEIECISMNKSRD